MSVAGCYTDFHIDMGGTSVWYHVLKGKKVSVYRQLGDEKYILVLWCLLMTCALYLCIFNKQCILSIFDTNCDDFGQFSICCHCC